MILKQVNHQIIKHISLGVGHRTKCSASGISVCLCPYMCFFRPLDPNNMNPEDFSNQANSCPVQLQSCLICIAKLI